MPRLPDFTDLGGVTPGAPRSMVDIPTPDIAGAARAVAQGVGQVGESIDNVRRDREDKFRKQERFDTRMGLLRAEEAYASRVKDLDPLDPEYVEKKKAARRETFGPVLSAVKDPENRMEFDLATQADYVELGIRAESEQRAALGKKAEIDVATYADGLRKRMRTPGYTGDAREELRQAIEENQFLDQTQKEALFRELGNVIDADSIEAEYEAIAGGADEIDGDEVISTIKRSPAWGRLDADAQDKVEDSIKARVEKQNKTTAAAAKIDLQRSTVDYAIQEFDDPAEAEAFIKSTLTDPDTREDALMLFRKEQDQMAENERRRVEQNIMAAWDQTIAALDANDPTTALKIVRTADIPPKERDALLERIDKGNAVVDDTEVYNEIQALKLGSPQDRERFANLDLVKLQGKLKPATIEGLAKEQETIRKQLADTGKVISLETPAAMLDQRLREIEIDISSKASPADLRTARAIRSMVAQNLQNAARSAGRDLTPPEIEKVMDQTFMQFRSKQAGWFSTGEVSLGLPDVMERFTEEEDRLELSEGALLDEAVADFQSVGLEITPQNLNEWLKRKMDGAAQ